MAEAESVVILIRLTGQLVVGVARWQQRGKPWQHHRDLIMKTTAQRPWI